MRAEERRRRILELLEGSSEPLPGCELARISSVSRQVVVQDIALLRREGHPIVGTHTGYALKRASGVRRLVQVRHGACDIGREMDAVLACGASMEDVAVDHAAYGRISVPLGIGTHDQAARLAREVETGAAVPLLRLTDGLHSHHIAAPDEEALASAIAALDDLGYLVSVDEA